MPWGDGPAVTDPEEAARPERAGEPTSPRPDAPARRLPATTLAWTLTGINVVIWLAMELAGGSTSSRTLVDFGAKVNSLIARGEYWRLLTSVFLHIGLLHLLFNMFALLSIGRLAESIYGHARFLAIYLVSGVSGALFSYLFSRSPSAGASGAIFGVAGALAVFYAANRPARPIAGQGQLGGILMLLAFNGIYGFLQPGVDNWGHAGGLISGVALAAWLTPRVTPLLGPEGQVLGFRWEPLSRVSWAIVPLILAILGVAAVVIPGR